MFLSIFSRSKDQLKLLSVLRCFKDGLFSPLQYIRHNYLDSIDGFNQQRNNSSFQITMINVSIIQTCYLMQCKDSNVCEDVEPSLKKDTRLIFLNKTTTTTTTKETFCSKQHSGGLVWEKTPSKMSTEQPCPRAAVGKEMSFH